MPDAGDGDDTGTSESGGATTPADDGSENPSGFDRTGDTKPTDANTVAEITAWLDAHSIDHTGKTLKADLLALVPAE